MGVLQQIFLSPRPRAAVVGFCWLCLVINAAGCGVSPQVSSNTSAGVIEKSKVASSSFSHEKAISDSIAGHKDKEDKKVNWTVKNPSATPKREERLQSDLEEASLMMKSGNLEGALRLVNRLEVDNAQDPYITMQTSYLKAMVYHRMNDAKQRKEAMDKMLKSMEALQKDERFRKAYEEGKECSELIQMSIEKSGPRYGTN